MSTPKTMTTMNDNKEFLTKVYWALKTQNEEFIIGNMEIIQEKSASFARVCVATIHAWKLADAAYGSDKIHDSNENACWEWGTEVRKLIAVCPVMKEQREKEKIKNQADEDDE